MNTPFMYVVAVLLLYACGLTEGGALDRKRIEITNDLSAGTELTVQCKSKNDDMRSRTLKHGEIYSWGFRVNFFQTTQYFCNFQWTENGTPRNHWVDIFKNSKIFTVEGDEILWKVHSYGVCRRLYRDDSCLKWNK